MFDKPFSQACENNKDPILQVLRNVFKPVSKVWEIGSGTGQHACYFAEKLPLLQWQPTDRDENIPGISRWVIEAGLDNLLPPLPLDVNEPVWPVQAIDALFTANTLHILSWQEVTTMFERLKTLLTQDARLCIYGPFNYGGNKTCASNARFDNWLKARNPLSGIRDSEAVLALAEAAGLQLLEDEAMPANNRLWVMQKSDVN
ncbi:MAG: methylase [Gammaproteobacteria bacterium HGW-Gammaproteobacteria-3]|nr:MAG: methylase [Gammaproteobacteria bacterium HGW-Gammaproteobacteria-3]